MCTPGRRTGVRGDVIGWSYDAAGNLLNDGTGTSTYDALNRLVQHSGTAYAYNGDGILVQAGDTRYTQDLAAPLAQVLHDGNAAYVYGHERLAAIAQDGTRTWYLGDALGSIRMRLDDAGIPLDAAVYTPFGIPHEAMPAPFGFTGELHDAGLVYLRARWYNPGSGTFATRDPFAGYAERPYSLHPYQYAYSNPVLWTDPSGEQGYRCRPYDVSCQMWHAFVEYTAAVEEEIEHTCQTIRDDASLLLEDWQERFLAPKDIGYLQGINGGANVLGVGVRGGREHVFDTYTFGYGAFHYGSGEMATTMLDIGVEGYLGFVTGWSNFLGRKDEEGNIQEPGIKNYAGDFYYGSVSLSAKLVTGSLTGVVNDKRTMYGVIVGVGVGLDFDLDSLQSAPRFLKKLIPATIGSGGWGRAVAASLHRSYTAYKWRLPTSADADAFVKDMIADRGFWSLSPIIQVDVIGTALANGYLWDRYP